RGGHALSVPVDLGPYSAMSESALGAAEQQRHREHDEAVPYSVVSTTGPSGAKSGGSGTRSTWWPSGVYRSTPPAWGTASRPGPDQYTRFASAPGSVPTTVPVATWTTWVRCCCPSTTTYRWSGDQSCSPATQPCTRSSRVWCPSSTAYSCSPRRPATARSDPSGRQVAK